MAGKKKKNVKNSWLRKMLNKDVTSRSYRSLGKGLKYEMKYDPKIGKMVGDKTKGWLKAPTASTGANIIGKLVAKSALPIAVGKAAYDIGKASYETNKEIKKNVSETSKRSDELIAAIRAQRKRKRNK